MSRSPRLKLKASLLITFIIIPLLFLISCREENTEQLKSDTQHSFNKPTYRVLLPADDPRNPLSIWRIPITEYWLELSDSILGPLKGKLTPHQKAVLFMLFMNDFKVGIPSNPKPETVVRERVGSCGNFSNVFCALMAVNDIPCRLVNLHNYPKDSGHTVTEVYYNGRWHLYDPTYSAYYTTTPNELFNPYVLSFKELREGGGFRKDVVRVVLNPKRLYMGAPRSLKFLGPEIYVKAEPAGPIGPDKPFYYPLKLDILNKSVISEEDFGPKNQGASYLGAAGINNNWIFYLSGLKVGKEYNLIVEPAWLGGEVDFRKAVFKAEAECLKDSCNLLDGELFKTTKDNLSKWKIRFKAKTGTSIIKVQHPYRGPKFFYMKVKRISLREAR